MVPETRQHDTYHTNTSIKATYTYEMEARNHRKRSLVCLVVTNSKINFKASFTIEIPYTS